MACIRIERMANLIEAGAVGKQLGAAKTTVFNTKTWFLFVVD